MAKTDAELIEQTPELLSEASDDITPQLYENFFDLAAAPSIFSTTTRE